MAMTILNADLVKDDWSRDQNGLRGDREYDVYYTGTYDGFEAASIASIIDQNSVTQGLDIGTEVSEGSGCYLESRNIRYVDRPAGGSPGVFTIALVYRESSIQFTENPLSRKDTIIWNRQDTLKDIFYDDDGKAIVTVPGELYARLPQTHVPTFGAVIRGYRSSLKISLDNQSDFNIVNNANITLDGVTVLAKKARYAGATGSKEIINGYTVYAHEWRLEFAPYWHVKILHAGNYELDGGVVKRITDASGKIRTMPWPLSEAGAALADGYDPATVYYKEYLKTVKEVDFSYFGWNF